MRNPGAWKRVAVSALVFSAGAAVVWFAFFTGFGKAQAYYSPYCPSEDSCAVQYHDHHMRVIRVVP